ncbi:MAG: GbsR/MarR family transcriptional regulator [Phycisphaerales bacterium JB041]
MPRTAPQPDPLREAQDRFIATWGKMGSAWGISRTMAEVHALLFIKGDPLCTDDVMDRLEISRGSASMSLRALVEWGVVSRAHKRGDRKEYFTADQDVWTLFRAVVRERMKREVDPLLASLFEIRDLTRGMGGDASEHNLRLDELLQFFEIVQAVGQRFISPSGEGLQAAAEILSKTSA